jgi:V8-like Glu-specific endopeptidase
MRLDKLAALAALSGFLWCLPAASMVKTGEVLESTLESPHPVTGPWRYEMGYPGAATLRVHLAELKLGEKDQFRLLDASGRQVYALGGPFSGALWLPSSEGDRATVEIHPGGGSSPWGLRADLVSYGYSTARLGEALVPESICGQDDTKDAVCYQASDPAKWDAGAAVARFSFSDPETGSGACTGFLVSPYGHFITNNHCIASEIGAQSINIAWLYQNQNCGSGPASQSSAHSAHLVWSDYTLDYALMVITNDAPQTRYGYLTLNPNLPGKGDTMWIAGHPLGGPKRFSVYSDKDNGDAKVQDVNVQGNGSGTDIAYYADTQGGSSGSPVMAVDNSVIALHHFGIAGSTCTPSDMNQGVEMSKIYPQIAQYLDQFFWPTASQTDGDIPLTVAFAANPTGGQGPYTYDWDFGDGSAHSSVQNPSHTYEAQGSFTVAVTVGDGSKTKTDTHLTVTATEPGVVPPTILSVSKATDPFRLILTGGNFHNPCTVKIGGVAVPTTTYKDSTKVVAKGGSTLKAMVPKGTAVSVTVTNSDDGGVSVPWPYTR